MKHRNLIVVAAVVAVSFGVGHLTAQPARVTAPPPEPVVDPEKEAFMSDFGAAMRLGNQKKAIRLMDEAVGDAKLTDALVIKTWDVAYNVAFGKMDPQLDRRDVLQATFLMKQQQKQIELLAQILAEMKKSNAGKPK